MEEFLPEIRENPESSPLIAKSIAATLLLFFVGVIYPLSFLPIPQNEPVTVSWNAIVPAIFSLRGSILLVVSSVFTVINLVFLRVNQRMRYPEKFVSNIEQAIVELKKIIRDG